MTQHLSTALNAVCQKRGLSKDRGGFDAMAVPNTTLSGSWEGFRHDEEQSEESLVATLLLLTAAEIGGTRS